jgi:hypothetical protein
MSMKRQNCDSWRGTKGISAATLVGVTIVEWYLPNPTNGWWIVHTRPTNIPRRALPNPTNAVGGSFILSLHGRHSALSPESHQRSWWIVHTQPTRDCRHSLGETRCGFFSSLPRSVCLLGLASRILAQCTSSPSKKSHGPSNCITTCVSALTGGGPCSTIAQRL